MQQPIEHMYNPQAPPYGRYHDPNMPPMDMYGRYHPGGKKNRFDRRKKTHSKDSDRMFECFILANEIRVAMAHLLLANAQTFDWIVDNCEQSTDY